MKNRNVIIGIVVLAVALIVAVIFMRPRPAEKVVDQPKMRKEIYNFDARVCPGETITYKMADPYLRGLIEEGTDVSVVINYYGCNPIEHDDVVLYRYSEFNDPVFRRVVAVAGDKYDLVESTEHRGWELIVNGKRVHGVKGEAYAFGGKMPPPLKLAVEQNGGRLAKGQAIVLAAFPPGDRDSGVFGVVAVADFIGKAKIRGEK